MRWVTLGLLLLAALIAGCGASIGDSCSTNVDCSTTGDRICDTAQTEGYCTVEGCDRGGCPDDAACVRFFTANFLAQGCDPATEDSLDPSVKPTNNCTTEEICLTSGLCAQRTSERRFCMQPCESDGDCRGGYQCARTGVSGAEAIPDPVTGQTEILRFCVQRP